MEDHEMINLWKTYGHKLDESLLVNKKNAEDITRLKVKSLLSSMKLIKIFTIFVGILWVGLVDILIINLFSSANAFFLISAGIQVLLTKVSIVIYLYQLIIINQVDISEPVITTQRKLAELKSTTLWIARILLLQLPVWTTYYWNKSMLIYGNIFLFIIQFLITGLFLFLAVWLFINIKYENRGKRWFRWIFNGNEWTPLIRSIELLHDIKEYRN